MPPGARSPPPPRPATSPGPCRAGRSHRRGARAGRGAPPGPRPSHQPRGRSTGSCSPRSAHSGGPLTASNGRGRAGAATSRLRPGRGPYWRPWPTAGRRCLWAAAGSPSSGRSLGARLADGPLRKRSRCACRGNGPGFVEDVRPGPAGRSRPPSRPPRAKRSAHLGVPRHASPQGLRRTNGEGPSEAFRGSLPGRSGTGELRAR